MSWPKALCGGDAYDPDISFCASNSIIKKCGGLVYDPADYSCNADDNLAYTQAKITALGATIPAYCGTVGNCGILEDARETPVRTYRWVKIGTGANEQTWMAENLNYATESGSWCKSDDDNSGLNGLAATSTYCDTYGRVYDWATATAATTCPTDWHLPSDAEWQTMEVSLGMTATDAATIGWRVTDQGSQLKSTSGWPSGGMIGTNTSGFTALPAGNFFAGSFNNVGSDANFWTATANVTFGAWYRYLTHTYATVHRSSNSMLFGFSVRCLKDSN